MILSGGLLDNNLALQINTKILSQLQLMIALLKNSLGFKSNLLFRKRPVGQEILYSLLLHHPLLAMEGLVPQKLR